MDTPDHGHNDCYSMTLKGLVFCQNHQRQNKDSRKRALFFPNGIFVSEDVQSVLWDLFLRHVFSMPDPQQALRDLPLALPQKRISAAALSSVEAKATRAWVLPRSGGARAIPPCRIPACLHLALLKQVGATHAWVCEPHKTQINMDGVTRVQRCCM